jgi:outer membrane protein
MRRFSQACVLLPVALFAMGAKAAQANELKKLYELALSRDTTLQAAHFQRDALIESRPQALARWLPQISGSAEAVRERVGFDTGPAQGSSAADCAISSTASTQHCYGTSRQLGLNLSQTLWSFQSFSALKEANFQVAAAESSYRGAQQSLLLRVSQAYFGILSAADQLAANRNERDAFGALLNQARVREQTGVGPRSDVEQAQAFYDATEQNVIDAQNALDDANLAMSELVGEHVAGVTPLRDNIPLKSPEPASADDWVSSARQDNFDVRTAQLNMEAASRDVGVQRGRGLPTLALAAIKLWIRWGCNSPGPCFRAARWPRPSANRAPCTANPRSTTMRRNAKRSGRPGPRFAALSPAFSASPRRTVPCTPASRRWRPCIAMWNSARAANSSC